MEFGGEPSRIHNLVSLINEFQEISGFKPSEDILLYLSVLNGYYFEMRYLEDDFVSATAEMAEEAHEYAKSTVSWLESCTSEPTRADDEES